MTDELDTYKFMIKMIYSAEWVHNGEYLKCPWCNATESFWSKKENRHHTDWCDVHKVELLKKSIKLYEDVVND